MPKKGDFDTCLFCLRRITYGPYYYRREKAVNYWTHEEGTRSCLTTPENWTGPWPKALPGGSLL